MDGGGSFMGQGSHTVPSHTGSESIPETDSSSIPSLKEKKVRWRPEKKQKEMLEDAFNVMKRKGSLGHKEVNELTAKLCKHGSVTKKSIRKWLQNRKYMDQKQQQGVAAQTEESIPVDHNLEKALADNVPNEEHAEDPSEADSKTESSEAAGPLTICVDAQGFIYVGRQQKPTPSQSDLQ
ncbi:WUSCHEL-related homeobox 8-like isoform X2 [Aristolochia californica]|uniref:WUSCHEL-related homeobox 8-like isoform X2 n=1 Tax=Aristolochia californica TaxID=171875 RepID=UPI0035DD1005